MSGKGGVGKSTVTALLATGAKKAGFRTGILDADITGPSIPKMFGLKAGSEKKSFSPALSPLGIKIMSLNLLLDNEEDPVIWRGPLIGGAVKQFWEEVKWGELDYLFIDLPPGTADAPLTVMQFIALDGLIMVSSPQELAVMVVKKALKMAAVMKVPVLGLVENMNGFVCPHCGEKVDVFGSSKADAAAAAANIPLIARIPLDKQLAAHGDAGTIEAYESGLFKAFLEIQQKKQG
ncbi:MAG TPA: Mrp/NBP35 family ATP-binding protein [Firmicutes bacterium]|nr:Mrp/NBP35 family ATP-binding protein [Bacillota bacterium]